MTKVLNFIGRQVRISKELGGKLLRKGHSGMSIINDDAFCKTVGHRLAKISNMISNSCI